VHERTHTGSMSLHRDPRPDALSDPLPKELLPLAVVGHTSKLLPGEVIELQDVEEAEVGLSPPQGAMLQMVPKSVEHSVKADRVPILVPDPPGELQGSGVCIETRRP
jgi:hypothetical protein